jgi:nitroreductase
MLNALDAIKARRSVREFESTPIPMDVIRNLVETAGAAPSSKNTQPWRLYLLQGASLEALRTEYLAAFDAQIPAKAQYSYSPNPLPLVWTNRARDCGMGIFKHKGIGREDKEKRLAHDRANFEFFNAPQVFFLGTDQNAYSHGTIMDCGFVYDNLMIGLAAMGYGSCPQFSAVMYPEILKKHIAGSDDTLFIAGLPFGTPKAGSLVNGFQPPRLPIDEWFKVFG